MKKGTKREGTEKGKTLIILCITIIIALVAIIVVLIQRKDEPHVESKPEEPKRNVVVTESDAEEAVTQMTEEDFVEPGYYISNMTMEWHFPSGDAISPDARVDNVLGNTNPIYFDVFLADNEEEPIFRSPVIPVGSFLEHIALDEVLDAGTYDCIVVYHLVDEEQNTVSTLRVAIHIIVES